MALRWVAIAPIWNGQFRAFNPGEIVPDSVEARFNYSGQNLVVQIETDDTDFPDEETGVALRADVVLRKDLHIGTLPPTSPTPGMVWIDTTPA